MNSPTKTRRQQTAGSVMSQREGGWNSLAPFVYEMKQINVGISGNH